MTEFLLIPNEVPAGGFTRAQLLNMLKTMSPAAAFVDNTTIERTGGGGIGVKAIPQSKVTDLVTNLAAKQALNSLLTAIAGISSNGLIERTGSGSVTTRVIGTDVQAYHSFLNALTLAGDGVLIKTGSAASVSAFLKALADVSGNGVLFKNGSGAELKVIGTDIQAQNAKLQDIAALTSLAAGDIIQWDGTNFVRIARQTAVADVDQSALPASISDPPTQAEVAGLRTVLVDLLAQHEALRDRFQATGGNGLLADA